MNTSKVSKLSDSTANEICSWQVLPDLRTAVKELLDNAIDANCKSIMIEFNNFGLEGFEVCDDGHGIDPEDLPKIAKKGATSKIKNFEDIYEAQTLGFRGEALAALRSLGDMTICSKRECDSIGTEVKYDKIGNIVSKIEKVRNNGTTVKVIELFKNVPVRYNEFKRTHKIQYRNAVDLIQEYSLVNYSMQFTITNIHPEKGRQTVFLKGLASNIDQNIELVLGKNLSSQLIPLDFKIIPDTIIIKGFVKKTVASGSLKSGKGKPMLNMFINKRPIHMPKIFSNAISEIYKKYQADTSPGAILFMETKKSADGKNLVDVNISPNKMDVIIEGEKEIGKQIRDQLDTFLSKIMPTRMEEVGQKELPFKPLKTDSPRFSQKNDDKISTALHNPGPLQITKRISPSSSQSIGSQRDSFEKPRFGGYKPWDNTGPVANASSGSMDFSGVRTYQFGVPRKSNRMSQESEESKDSKDEDDNAYKIFEFKPQGLNSERAKPNILSPEVSSQERVYLFNNPPPDVSMRDTIPMKEDEKLPVAMASQSSNNLSQTSSKFDQPEAGAVSTGLNFTATNNLELGPFIPKITVIDMSETQKINELPSAVKPLNIIENPKITEECSSNINAKGDILATQLNKVDFANIEVIGQFNLGFILCRHNTGLYIVDQHAADEKFNYEKFASTTILQSQPLLKPLEVKLTSAELLAAQQNPKAFNENGFKVTIEERTDSASGQLIGYAVIRAMPYSENTSFTVEDFYELLGLMTSHENTFMNEDSKKNEGNSNEESKPALLRCAGLRPSKIKKMLASRACRRSVMVGTALNYEEMTNIVHHLAGLDCPWTCPHGRPTIRLLMKLC